ncbi:MAG: DUF4215 domain-containing protein [Myxococcales bacterium]|nr:DUF4215 domain-containing protein [Myxococcales bacterium]
MRASRALTNRTVFTLLSLGVGAWVFSPLAAGCGGDTTEVATDTDTGTPSETGDDGDLPPVCGNGAKEGTELCDDGNKANGDGCENDCTWSCKPPPDGDPAKCDDGNACNGTEVCGADHKCAPGKPLADGDACGTGKVCKGGTCIDSVCGDSVKTAPEECDDGNTTNGDGCDSCKFSCVAADAARNCKSADACIGDGTCDDAKHTCTAGTAKADGTTCGTGLVCKAGACVSVSCGDGIVSGTEECDLGAGNGPGTGCEVDCKFSCKKSPDSCPDTEPCNGTEACATVSVGGKSGQKCAAGTPLGDGAACGTGKTCKSGVCASANCGNGVLDTGEDCDFGAGNGPGTGCELSCKFSCTTAPDSCPDSNPCNGVETCAAVTVGGKTGQKCSPGTPLAACAACGTGGVCVAGACKSSVCGDACVDAAKGEACDPPATGTCDASCKKIVAAVCGNGVREAGEQCDDSNTTNLDGCDSKCQFEQDHRFNSLKMQWGTDAFCTANTLGGSIGGVAQGQVQKPLDDGITAGTLNILFKYMALDDLTGTSDPAVTLGQMGGTVVTGTGYSGTSDLDWWYTVDPLSIDATRTPTATLAGSIAAKVLNAGPGNLKLTLTLSGALTPLNLSAVRVRGTIGATSKPLASTAATPGHLVAEHLDPALVSFATTSNGQLCGNVSAYSLSKVPVPAAILAGGSVACIENYSATNSLLDVLIGGCRVIGGLITAVSKTQPDVSDPTAPVAGAGPKYTLSASSSSTKVVDTCKDKSGATVTFATCINSAAYSSYFKFTTDRVIVK